MMRQQNDSTDRPKWESVVLVILAALVVAVSLAACGSGSSSTSSSAAPAISQGEGGGEAETEPAKAESEGGAEEAEAEGATQEGSYTGPEKGLPEAYGAPEKVTGEELTFGYLQVYGALPVLGVEQRGAEEEAENLGVKMIVKDAELNPQKQVSQFNQLLAQGVDGILVYPVVASSLLPSLEKAEAEGIPVIATEARPDVAKPMPAGYSSDVEQSFDTGAWLLAKTMSERNPGASFGVIGIGAPVEAVKYQSERQQYWGEHFGQKFVGESDAQEDTPSGYGKAASQLLSKNPEQIYGYNDVVALTASTTARSSGDGDVEIAAVGGAEEAILAAIKAGTIVESVQGPWAETGQQMVVGAYDAATEQNVPLPETIGLKPTLVTQENVDEIEPTK